MLKGWKTLGFAIATAGVGVLEQADWINLVPAGNEGIAVAVVAGIAAVLRFFTTSPIFSD